MPAANDDRKPVGTTECSDCNNTASFYQIKKGNRRGELYKRCPPRSQGGCGTDQRNGENLQRKWLEEMQRTGESMIDHPLIDLAEPTPAQVEGESEINDNENPQTSEKPKGLLGLVGLAVVGIAVMIWG